MIAVRVRDHERRERVQPHPPELAVDPCLGRAGIDEHRPAGVSSRIASPCPTSRNETRSPAGGDHDGGGWRAHQPSREEQGDERDRGDDGCAAGGSAEARAEPRDATMTPATARTTVRDDVCAYGSDAIRRAENAIQAAASSCDP